MKGTTIAACLLALSRELRTLERLLQKVALEATSNGFGDACLPRAMAMNLARLAGRADGLALQALNFCPGHPDPLLDLTAQPRSSSSRN